ncbi:MAG TPA: FHA domain-containing protein [Pseudomonadales bacterium]|nr:FHA domain-containing protein [Pseudomonadales bacterium]
MRAVLQVTKDRKLVSKVTIAANPFVIGRAQNCSLPLDESLASREHVHIVFEGGSFWLVDQGSRNGTMLNGEKVTGKKELRDGDEIVIGTTHLTFVWDKSGQDDEADDDKTRVASGIENEKAPGQAVVEKKDVGDIEVKLRITEGPLTGGFFRNWESPLTIGRGLTNNVVLVDDAVSTAHAQIVQEGEDYFIQDLKSSNGTFLDGVKVQKTKLSNGQKIKVGISTLIFEMVDLRKKRKNIKNAAIAAGVLVVIVLAAKFLRPPDIAGGHIRKGMAYQQAGDLTNALAQYEAALAHDPNRTEAKKDIEDVKEIIAAKDMLNQAREAAANEDYEKAKDLCNRVLRDYPNSAHALELQAVIESIENAQLAFAARNWTDAKQLLEKAQQTYPQSELLRSRLDHANSELTAQQNLAKAKDDLAHQQLDMAQPLFQSIPSNSVYFVEARQELDQIALSRQIAQYLNQAVASYQNGNISDALQQIAAGLQQSPGAQALLDLQARIRQMNELVKPLESAEALSSSDDVSALVQGRQACQNVINLEPDPLNTFRKRAVAAQTRISANLSQDAQSFATKAAYALQSGNEKDAIRLYNQAIAADPNDQNIATQRAQLLTKLQSECKQLYDKGIVHLDLQQVDLAKQAFQQVMAISAPGEKYYDLAAAKLKDLNQ